MAHAKAVAGLAFLSEEQEEGPVCLKVGEHELQGEAQGSVLSALCKGSVGFIPGTAEKC